MKQGEALSPLLFNLALEYAIRKIQSINKPIGKRPLGRPRRRWEDNIMMDLEEISISAGNWVDSAQDNN